MSWATYDTWKAREPNYGDDKPHEVNEETMTENEVIIGLCGLVELFVGRDDVTNEQRDALLKNHRYLAAKGYLDYHCNQRDVVK